jgi:polyisoprenoid-binding protein YceI
MRTISTSFVAATLLFSASAFAAPATYDLDGAHSAATFSVKHLAVSTVRGEFGKLTGTIVLDPANPTAAKIEASIDASTVSTRSEKRDAHLKSPDFFDVAKYPTLTFKSTRVDKGQGGALKLTGDLTIHGVTKSVTFDVQALSPETKTPFGTTVIGTSATAKINRNDFGVTGGTAGAIVGNDVSITLDLEMVKRTK